MFLPDGREREDVCVVERRRQRACDRLGACVSGVLEYAVLDMKTVRELCLEDFRLLDGHLKQEQSSTGSRGSDHRHTGTTSTDMQNIAKVLQQHYFLHDLHNK